MAARKSNPPRRGMVGKISVREAAELHHLYLWPAHKIAEERAGTCPQAVVQALARYGVPRRPPEGRKVFRSDFDRARRKGWTKGQLARHLGMEVRSLIRAQKRMGYSWPERDGMADKPKGREVMRTEG